MKGTSDDGARNCAAGTAALNRVRLFHGLAGVGMLWLLVCLSACGRGAGDYDEYVTPPGADAQLVVHPQYGDTFDVFLDGKLLGRISWTQAYAVASGQHVFSAKEAGQFARRGHVEDYPFTIAPGETVHLAVTRMEADWYRIRISEIQP